MNPTGAIIFAIFGAIWSGVALSAMTGGVDALTFAPVLPALVIVVAAIQIGRTAPKRDPAVNRRVQRVVGIASAIEGVAIFITANVLANMGQYDLVMPAIAVIVGLHFIPIAQASGRPAFLYVLTVLMLALAGASLLLPPTAIRMIVVGLGAALLLWGASALTLVRLSRETNAKASAA